MSNVSTPYTPQAINSTPYSTTSPNSTQWGTENLQPVGGILLLQTGGFLLLQDGVSDFLLQ